MGLDVPSVAVIACLESTMPAHNELLAGDGRRFLIIEEMNLDQDLSATCRGPRQSLAGARDGQRAVLDRGSARLYVPGGSCRAANWCTSATFAVRP